MKVALINPNWNQKKRHETTYNRAWFPLSLAYAYSLLKNNGIEPLLIDGHALNLSIKEIKERVKGCDKIFITTSPYDRWQCPDKNISPALKIFEELIGKECYVLGQHVTVMPKEILRLTKARAGIIGSPEFVVLDICKNKNISKVNNVAFFEDDSLIRTKRKNIDANKLPAPAYDAVDPSNYEYEIFGNRFAIVETTRGCKYNCTFCCKEEIFGKYSEISLDNVVNSLRKLAKSGFQNAYIMDLNFLSNKNRAKELCRHIIESKINVKWCCQSRIGCLDEETAALMKDAGCTLVHIGIENVSQRLQKTTNKNMDFLQIGDKLRHLKNNSIKTAYFILLGLGEKTDDITATKTFIKVTKPDYISVHHLQDFKSLSSRKVPIRERLVKASLLMMNLRGIKLRDIIHNPFKKIKIFMRALRC